MHNATSMQVLRVNDHLMFLQGLKKLLSVLAPGLAGGTSTELSQAVQRVKLGKVLAGLMIETLVTKRPCPADAGRGWLGVMTFPKAPQSSCGALMLPQEGGLWMLSLGGRGVDKPPGDEAGFLIFARALRTPTIYNAIRSAIRSAIRIGSIARYAFPQSLWRHFERTKNWGVGPMVGLAHQSNHPSSVHECARPWNA